MSKNILIFSDGTGQAGGLMPDERVSNASGILTFRQLWFAGNHSDIGGSYPENESRLSDASLSWMIEAAEAIEGGIKIDRSVLKPYPSADGVQHDERKIGFPVLTKWFHLTWQGRGRKIDDPKAPLHDSVYERFALPGVVEYDLMKVYRPETLRKHEHLADYYKDIPVPAEQTGVLGFIRSFFLTS